MLPRAGVFQLRCDGGMDPRARRLIERLGLEPHPEGGFYREHFRAERRVRPDDGRAARAALTAIHFLLLAGQRSRWHAVASDELWTFHEGEPLVLVSADPEALRARETTLGRASDGHAASFAVPAGHWQAAWPTGAFAFVTCASLPASTLRISACSETVCPGVVRASSRWPRAASRAPVVEVRHTARAFTRRSRMARLLLVVVALSIAVVQASAQTEPEAEASPEAETPGEARGGG